MSELNSSINIHIQRTPHVTATDFDFLDSMVREPRFHIYAPELDGDDGSALTGFRKIASGDSKVYKDVMQRTDRDSAWAKSFSALFMLRKPIESYDATPEQCLSNETLRSFGNVAVDLAHISAGQFIDNISSQLTRLPNFVRVRDNIITENISERLPLTIKESPKLRTLGQVGLLMTIGDNHRLLDSLLVQKGFSVTTNEIPVTGAHEKAGLKYLTGDTPTESEVLEAAAFNLVRNFVTHGSTYKLRSQLNTFAEGIDENDIASLLFTIQTKGTDGVRDLVTQKLDESGMANDLTFIVPGSQHNPIKLKDTYERRGGKLGIRTGIF